MVTPIRAYPPADHESTPHFADVVEHLFVEYEAVLPLHVIRDVAYRCARDLSASPPSALPELILRLARVRLNELVATEHRQTG